MAEAGHRLARILAVAADMMTDGRLTNLRSMLDEDVFWQGPTPELFCSGRSQVLDIMSRGRLRQLQLTRVEVEEAGDDVIVSAEGPGLADDADPASGTTRTLVFTFRGDRVIRIESFADRTGASQRIRS